MLAPAIAALVGIGVVALWTEYLSLDRRGWILPLELAVTACARIQVLQNYVGWNSWLRPAILTLSTGAVTALVVARLAPRQARPGCAPAAVAVGILALLLAPSIWAASTIWYGGETRTPTAGPRPLGDRVASTSFTRDAAPLLAYLQAHEGTARYPIASEDQEFAQYAILESNEPVITFGGFNGNDPVLSLTRLANLVNDGAVRYFLLEQAARKQNRAARWVAQQCTEVPKEAWQSERASPRQEAKGIANPLYDCGNALGRVIVYPHRYDFVQTD